MVYVEFWDNDYRMWQLAKMNIFKALICCKFNKDCHIVPRKNICFKG